MSSVIRKLEIYHLSSIGCPNTIALYDWLNDTFSNLKAVTLENGNILYHRNSFENIFIEDRVYDRLLIDYVNVFHILMIRFNLHTTTISLVINYFLCKCYFISKNHIVKYSEISTYLAESKFYEKWN